MSAKKTRSGIRGRLWPFGLAAALLLVAAGMIYVADDGWVHTTGQILLVAANLIGLVASWFSINRTPGDSEHGRRSADLARSPPADHFNWPNSSRAQKCPGPEDQTGTYAPSICGLAQGR